MRNTRLMLAAMAAGIAATAGALYGGEARTSGADPRRPRPPKPDNRNEIQRHNDAVETRQVRRARARAKP